MVQQTLGVETLINVVELKTVQALFIFYSDVYQPFFTQSIVFYYKKRLFNGISAFTLKALNIVLITFNR